MRNTFLLLVVLTLIPALSCVAQKKRKHKDVENPAPYPRVWIGNIHTYYTTRDSILAHPLLNTDSVGCRVSGFTVSLQAPGHPFFGPLYSNTWEMTQIQKDKIKEWDYKDVTLYIQDIHLNCHEKDATANPFSVKFDH
jgi:hypothetical protein